MKVGLEHLYFVKKIAEIIFFKSFCKCSVCFDLDDGFFNFNRYNAHSPQNGQTHAKNCAASIAKVLTCNHSVDPT